MSTHNSTRVRKWATWMLLLQLVVMLLPARHVSAADQQVVIPKAEVDAMVFQAILMQAFQDVPVETVAANGDFLTADTKDRKTSAMRRLNVLHPEWVIYEEFLIQGGELPGMDIVMEEYKAKYLKKIGTDYDKRSKKSYEEIIFTMLDIAKTVPELEPFVKDVWRTLVNPEFDRGTAQQNDTIYRVARKYRMREVIRERGPKTMQRVFQSSQEHTQVAITFDTLYFNELGVRIKDFDAYDYIQAHPDSVVPPAIVDRMRTDGTVSISLNDLKSFSQEEFRKINDSIDDLQSTLVGIDAKQDVILDYINNQEERARMQALAEAEAAEHQLKLNAIQSSLFIAYTLADVIDPEFGYQLATVGNATLQVAESLRGWMNAVAGLGTLGKIGSLSTVVMTGNVLGAVMNVVGLFGASGPTPEQMILEEIGKLRQQVDQLRTEMHSRFDRIDEELNTIYATMQDRFNLVDVQLGKLNGKLDEVQKTLVTLDLKLSRIERNNFEFLDALGRRPLLEAINGSLGYQQRTGVPMPYQPEFVSFENVLHGWATIHAFDALAAGPTQRDTSDGQVLAELNAYPLDSNINYLNGWLTAHGLPAIADERLASPRDWLFANRAYTQLALEWPEHMQRIDPQRQAALDEIGAEVEAAMKNISTITTMTGTVGNTLLFSNVFTYYQDKLGQVDASIAAIETNYLAELRAALQQAEPFDLYGGVNQALTYQTPEVTTMTCGDVAGHGSYPATNNLKTLIPNFNLYNLAEYLGLGEFSACLSDEWLDEYEHCDIDFEPPFERNCFMRGTHRGVLTVTFKGVPIMRQSFLGGDEVVADDLLRSKWTSNLYKQLFETLPGTDQPTPEVAAQQLALLNATTLLVEQWLADHQQALYGRLLNDLTNGALRTRIGELAGGKMLLDSFVTLGFSRAVNDDELLHAMLYGNQQLVEDSQIIQSYALSATEAITGTGILVNPRTMIMQTAEQRADAFNNLLGAYLAAITAQTHVEVADYTANARRELEFTMILAKEGTPVTPVPPATPVTPIPPTTPEVPVTPQPPSQPSDGQKRMHLPFVER